MPWCAQYGSSFNILVLPCISPWGYETINRWNAKAIDPNRWPIGPDTVVSPTLTLVDVSIEKRKGCQQIHSVRPANRSFETVPGCVVPGLFPSAEGTSEESAAVIGFITSLKVGSWLAHIDLHE